MKLKWKKRTKVLEINENKDRAAHCVLQLEHAVAPDGAVIQLVDVPFAVSLGITRAEFFKVEFLFGRKHLWYIETVAYSVSLFSLYQKPSSGYSEI